MVRVGDEARYPGGAPNAGGSSATPSTEPAASTPAPTPAAAPRVGLLMLDPLSWGLMLAGGLLVVGVALLTVSAAEEHFRGRF